MKKCNLRKLFASVILGCTLIGTSAARPDNSTTKPSNADDDDSFPSWMHSSTAPVTTRYGGRRGENHEGGFITIVAPRQAGVADQQTPCIYYFFTQSTTKEVEIAITKDGEIEPCYDVRLAGVSAGLNQIDLHKCNVPLAASTTYEVVIAVISDAEHRSRDQVCSTTVIYEPLAESIREQICQPGSKPSKTQAIEYLRAGRWYDSFDSISKSIDADPNNRGLHAWRWKLLNQPIVHLPEVAAIDLPAAK